MLILYKFQNDLKLSSRINQLLMVYRDIKKINNHLSILHI